LAVYEITELSTLLVVQVSSDRSVVSMAYCNSYNIDCGFFKPRAESLYA
jgi:hypothetical protein